ncbi:uncharacterized protein FTOL_10736 [Fusarium torulosum]|uniref:Uncharacterized protein n=1 Tax=Fusarium torulosum TaxID=33205 RepID=A0AAE8SM75_9HYPO|nr:uncharacterized protein FTOL_10736 [Fusarium torulosum]
MSSQEAKGQQVLNTEESLIMDLKAKVKELETTIETMIEAQEQEREDRELLGEGKWRIQELGTQVDDVFLNNITEEYGTIV